MNNRLDSHSKVYPGQFATFFSPQVIIFLGLLLFTLLLLAGAWLHEDAFITLRTVDNFINGYGLRYNVIERVQTFTHPLWMFALVLPYAVTKEPIFSTIFLSVVVSVAALYLLLRYLAPTTTSKLVVLTILISSRSYIDYGTSGLENPMSHLLLAAFYAIYFTRQTSVRSLFYLTLLASLAGVNRLDTLLFYMPPLLVYFFRLPTRKALQAVFFGFTPLMAWTLFSLIYYGFPFPNSAYAKLNTHIAATDLFVQGTYYFKDLLLRDPLTFLIISAGLIITFVERHWARVAVATGLILYLFYILRIGGDYMSGRFFTVPLLSATVLLIQSDWLGALSRRASLALLGVILVLGFLSADPVLIPLDSDRRLREEKGITNERAIYEDFTGLRANLAGETTADQHWMARSGAQAREDGERVIFRGGIGLAGYFAGPQVQIVDSLALSDVLLARLPVGNPKYWRIGHFKRVNPAGFKDSIRSGENVMGDPGLTIVYDTFQSITRDSLLDRERLINIWKVNSGQYAHLLDADKYVREQIRPLELEELCAQVSDTMESNGQCIREIPHQGFALGFAEKQYASTLDLALDGNYNYEFFFLDGDRTVGRLLDEAEGATGDELILRKIAVPEAVSVNGFDTLQMRPNFIGLDPENPRMVGQIKLTNKNETMPDQS